MILVCGIVCIKNQPADYTNNSEVVINRLETLQEQLGALNQEIKKPTKTLDLSNFNQDFDKLTSLIKQLQANDATTINHLLTQNRTEFVQKLDTLYELVTALSKKQHLIKYLPIAALPFKVISIDSIQQVSVATVSYNFKTIPLEKNDKLADWTVLNIDFGLQRMELENSNKEHVVVTLDVEQEESNG